MRTLLFLLTLSVEWGNNGSTWNNIAMSGSGTTSWSIVRSVSVLPSGAEGQSNLRLRWSFTIPPGIHLFGATIPCLSILPDLFLDDINLGQNSVLPVTFSNVKAYKTDNGIKIDWSILTESDVVNYQVERSVDGQNFISLAQLTPATTNGKRSDYNFLDASPNSKVNFYRIVSMEANGKKMYTAIMRVDANNARDGMAIYPNPVKGGQFSIQATDVPKGQYNLTVYSSNSQRV